MRTIGAAQLRCEIHVSHKQHNLRTYNRRSRVLSLSFEPLKIFTQVGVMKPAWQGVLP